MPLAWADLQPGSKVEQVKSPGTWSHHLGLNHIPTSCTRQSNVYSAHHQTAPTEPCSINFEITAMCTHKCQDYKVYTLYRQCCSMIPAWCRNINQQVFENNMNGLTCDTTIVHSALKHGRSKIHQCLCHTYVWEQNAPSWYCMLCCAQWLGCRFIVLEESLAYLQWLFILQQNLQQLWWSLKKHCVSLLSYFQSRHFVC